MAKQEDGSIVNDAIIKDIRDSIKDLEFGVVSIKVHNSRIVQIEITEKKRFDSIWFNEGSGI